MAQQEKEKARLGKKRCVSKVPRPRILIGSARTYLFYSSFAVSSYDLQKKGHGKKNCAYDIFPGSRWGR